MTLMDTPLFELWDFEPALKPARVEPARYGCGRHLIREDDEHWLECLGGRCPRCGETAANGFLGRLNHEMSAGGRCKSQWLLINHVDRLALVLNGEEEPGTNCQAVSHFGAKGHGEGGYMRRGIPIECVAVEYCEKWEWLTTHNVSPEALQPVTSASGIDLVARVCREQFEAVRKAYSE